MATTPRRHRRRWLGLSGGAGGLITGVGLAASLTVVLGLVWQLRPTDNALPRMNESPAGTAEEVILIEDTLPSTEPRTRIVEPPPVEEAPAAPAMTAPVPPPEPTPLSEPTPAPEPPAAAVQSKKVKAEPEPAPEAFQSDSDEVASSHEAAAEVAPVPAPAMAETEEIVAPDNEPRRATYTRAARAQAEQAGRKHESSRSLSAAPPAPASASGIAPVAEDSTAEMDLAETDAAPLPPLHEDTGLAPIDWLQRIRERRDAGDTDSARESLHLFRQAYPRVHLPDDLHPLLDAESAGR